jgi:hypothetical protein
MKLHWYREGSTIVYVQPEGDSPMVEEFTGRPGMQRVAALA